MLALHDEHGFSFFVGRTEVDTKQVGDAKYATLRNMAGSRATATVLEGDRGDFSGGARTFFHEHWASATHFAGATSLSHNQKYKDGAWAANDREHCISVTTRHGKYIFIAGHRDVYICCGWCQYFRTGCS